MARSSAPPDEPAKQASFRVDLLPLLAPGLGTEKAQAAMEAAAARCCVDLSAGLSQLGALAVLDEVAHVDGIVGVVARFAKARLLLR